MVTGFLMVPASHWASMGACVVTVMREPGWFWGFSLVCRGEGACR